jgi:hypothetical protein
MSSVGCDADVTAPPRSGAVRRRKAAGRAREREGEAPSPEALARALSATLSVRASSSSCFLCNTDKGASYMGPHGVFHFGHAGQERET